MVDDNKLDNSVVDGGVELDVLSGADWVLDKGVSVRDLVLSRLPVDGFDAYCGEGWVPPCYRGDWGRVVADLVVVCGALRGGMGRVRAFGLVGVSGCMLAGWVRRWEDEVDGCRRGFSTFLMDFFGVVVFVEGLVEESLSGVLLERALREKDRHCATYLLERNFPVDKGEGKAGGLSVNVDASGGEGSNVVFNFVPMVDKYCYGGSDDDGADEGDVVDGVDGFLEVEGDVLDDEE
jgi:hypothetical protein